LQRNQASIRAGINQQNICGHSRIEIFLRDAVYYKHSLLCKASTQEQNEYNKILLHIMLALGVLANRRKV